jgi:hypothetical protein
MSSGTLTPTVPGTTSVNIRFFSRIIYLRDPLPDRMTIRSTRFDLATGAMTQKEFWSAFGQALFLSE